MKTNLLKLLSVTVLSFTFSTTLFADGGLEENMKKMGQAIKKISKAIDNPSMNPASIKIADSFVSYASLAKKYLPEEIAQLPQADQAKRKALYEEMIDHSIELGEFLSTSLKSNDQAKAKHFLDQILAYEKEGHKEFKGNDLVGAHFATDLKTAMQNMGSDLKLIQAQASDASQNKASLKLAEDFIANAKDVKAFIPVSIANLPSGQQQARIDLYNKLTEKVITLGEKMVQAFSTGDNAKALSTVAELIASKKEGHFEFN
jgi:hypothetical protein